MSIKIENETCEKCGKLLEKDWYFCSNCGNSRQNYFMQCQQCHHIITDAHANFWPYCKYKINKIKDKASFTIQSAKPEIPIEKLQYAPVSGPVILENLKFNPYASKQILFSKRFTLFALVYILIISITGAISNYYASSSVYPPYWKSGFNLGRFETDVIVFLITYLIFGITFNVLLNFMQIKEEGINFIRIIGSYFPIFLVKDIIIIFIGIFSQNTSRQFSISTINMLLMLIIIIFVFFHLVITTTRNTDAGTFIAVLTIFACFIIALLLGYMYTSVILNNQY